MSKAKKPASTIVTDRKPTGKDPEGRYRVRSGAREETYEVIRGMVLRVVE